MSILRPVVRHLRRGAKEAMMAGFITERDLEEAEEAFPGIVRFFESLSQKPRTFLELLSKYERLCESVRSVQEAA